MKGNVAAARTKVEQIARGIDIGEKGTLGDLIFGPDQVTSSNPFELFSTVSLNSLPESLQSHKSHWTFYVPLHLSPTAPVNTWTLCLLWQAAAKKAAEEAAAKKAAAEAAAKKAAAEKAAAEKAKKEAER